MNGSHGTVDPPAAIELLNLIERFLEIELVPAQTDEKLRYRTKVAANLLRIARREFDQRGALAMDSDGFLVPPDILAEAGSLRAFADELLHGRRRLTDPATYSLVLRQVESKLAIASPDALAESPQTGQT
jgi:hypothetical protein